MLSALNTNGNIKIKEFKSTRDHTENMLKAMGYNIKVKEDYIYMFIGLTTMHWIIGIFYYRYSLNKIKSLIRN